MNEILGNNILRLRKENDLTQEELAHVLGITYQAVSKWETGVSCPDVSTLPLLADLFGVSIDELFGRKQKSLEETISEVIYAVDTKNSYEYAFELCWAILSGLAHIDGNIRGHHSYGNEGANIDKCYFSKLVADGGIACARLAPGFRTFFLMPEPEGSLGDKLKSIEEIQKAV